MRNPTLYGLKQKSDINITYNAGTKTIIKTNGCNVDTDYIDISEEICFSIPSHISINGIPIFPSKYEFINVGEVIYSKSQPPKLDIKLTDSNVFSERAKMKQNTITIDSLKLTDLNRKRTPSQLQVMKESATNHSLKLIEEGVLIIPDKIKSNVSWHWCHLISFRMLPTEKAQKKNNLFCGTAACNGHMTNIEAAVKRFIYEFKRPLSLEVTVTTYRDTEVARRIRYSVYDKKGSKELHCEYFDALTTSKTDVLDYESIYNRMLKSFKIEI